MATEVRRMSNNSLPRQFSYLEPHVNAWSLATENERNQKRLKSSTEEMREFYDAILPSIDEILDYLNQFPLDNMPADATRLFYLTLSLAEIALPVEMFKQTIPPNSFDPHRLILVHGNLTT
jgi:hypothetical protein